MARGISSAGSQVRIKSKLEAINCLNSAAATIACCVHLRHSVEAVIIVVCSGATSRPLDGQIA